MGDTDTTEENALLMLNPRLMPKLPLRLMLMPLPGIMVATMDTPTDTDTTVWDTVHTMVDTTDILGDMDTVITDKRLLQIGTPTLWSLLVLIYQCQSLTSLFKLANFYPPFELSTKPTTTALKNTEIPFFSKHIFITNNFIRTEEFFCFFF